MVGTPAERPIRGNRREFEISLRNGEANAGTPFTWVLRRPVQAAQREWLELDGSRPVLGHGQAPFEGEASTTFSTNSGNPFVNFRITQGPEGFIPYGLSSGRLELNEMFKGIYTARLIDADLTAVSGSQAGQRLYGIVALVTNRNLTSAWRELRMLTFTQETSDRGTVPGTVFSTTTVAFGE